MTTPTLAAVNPNHAHFPRNFTFSVLDGGFFGLALGLASFVTVIPLFVNSLTDSAVLIGLITATHVVGWQLPQILTVSVVRRLWRYKPMVLLMTLNERLPFLLLAIVAWQSDRLGSTLSLVFAFILLVWRGMGGGFTATAWQSMIAKIIPVERHGLFFTVQNAGAALLASGGAIVAGLVLQHYESPLDFTICFALAFVSISFSWVLLAQVREYPSEPVPDNPLAGSLRDTLRLILRTDANFRWNLIGRICGQVGWMAATFFTVYAVHKHDASDTAVGLMTALMMLAQTIAGPLMGWLGDRWNMREMMTVGGLSMALSAILAIAAPNATWFYLIFILAGITNVSLWAVALALTLRFGDAVTRPAYIGLTNTLTAPATLLAPLLGGLLADTLGYEVMFAVAAVGSLATAFVFHFLMQDQVSSDVNLIPQKR